MTKTRMSGRHVTARRLRPLRPNTKSSSPVVLVNKLSPRLSQSRSVQSSVKRQNFTISKSPLKKVKNEARVVLDRLPTKTKKRGDSGSKTSKQGKSKSPDSAALSPYVRILRTRICDDTESPCSSPSKSQTLRQQKDKNIESPSVRLTRLSSSPSKRNNKTTNTSLQKESPPKDRSSNRLTAAKVRTRNTSTETSVSGLDDSHSVLSHATTVVDHGTNTGSRASNSSVIELSSDEEGIGSGSDSEIHFQKKLKRRSASHMWTGKLVEQLLYSQSLINAKDEELEKLRDEVKRLKNEISWKEEQILELEDISDKNIELESQLATLKELVPKGKLPESLRSTPVVTSRKRSINSKSANDDAEKNTPTKKRKTKQDWIELIDDNDTVTIDDEEESDGESESKVENNKFSDNEDDSDDVVEIASNSRKLDVKVDVHASFSGDRLKDVEHASTKDAVGDDAAVTRKAEQRTKAAKTDTRKKEDKESETENSEKKKVDDVKEKVEDSKEEGDETNTPNKGRKEIRKIIPEKKLSSEAVQAGKAERQRRERVAALQAKFIIESKENTRTKVIQYTKLVFEVKEKNGIKTPIVEVNKKLVQKLKPHQVEAVKFLWSSTIESLEELKKEDNKGSGCILAHCMGLGKTLSCISLIHTLLTHKVTGVKTCMVVCPLNTVLNWKNEFEKWLDKKDRVKVTELVSTKSLGGRVDALRSWYKEGGVLIVGYTLFRRLANCTTRSKMKKDALEKTLINPGPDLVICDEGHILKNDGSAISKCMNRIRSQRRIVLTGTPLQNNLIEYHCMVNFIKPNLLGTRKHFCNRFVNPITNGQHSDSTPADVKVMKRRAHVLHELLSGFVQRKDYSALKTYLPQKEEYVIPVRLSALQIELYRKYLQISRSNDQTATRGSQLFSDYQNLMRIWTHPWVLHMEELRRQKNAPFEDDEFIATDDEEADEMEITESSTSESDDDDDEVTIIQKKTRSTRLQSRNKAADQDSDRESDKKLISGEVVSGWRTASRGPVDDPFNINEEKKKEEEWWMSYVKEGQERDLELSGKLVLLMEILKMAASLQDKVLVFSHSLLSLDIIEKFLAFEDESNKKSRNKIGCRWQKDEDYCRMDGSTNAQLRKKLITDFIDPHNDRMRLFLISTRAGSLGINLESANRVIIFDASWNPAHDVQSIFRVYRFGQVKPVFIYRFLAQGTMEEKIYERQIIKETLSERVIDEHQIDRHFSALDLQELYKFTPDVLDGADSSKDKPLPMLPKDVVLAELLTKCSRWIAGYHEHDSLLENRVDEKLSEEEKRVAWEEYEREKQMLINYQSAPNYSLNTNPDAAKKLGYSIQMPTQSMTSMASKMYAPRPQPFQVKMVCSAASNIPRIVEEILKFNPNITPEELQKRLQSFVGMTTGRLHGAKAVNQTQVNHSTNVKVATNPVNGPTTIPNGTNDKTKTAHIIMRSNDPKSQSSMQSRPSVINVSTVTNTVATPTTSSASTAVLPSRLPATGRLPADKK